MKKVAFCTLGCKVNQYETNAMEQQFIEKGYKVVSFNDIADIYVINTCTVTNMSDKKSRQMIRRAKQLNPKAIVVAVGCYVQVAKEKLEEIDELDLILGNNEKKEIVKYVEDYVGARCTVPKEYKEKFEYKRKKSSKITFRRCYAPKRICRFWNNSTYGKNKSGN